MINNSAMKLLVTRSKYVCQPLKCFIVAFFPFRSHQIKYLIHLSCMILFSLWLLLAWKTNSRVFFVYFYSWSTMVDGRRRCNLLFVGFHYGLEIPVALGFSYFFFLLLYWGWALIIFGPWACLSSSSNSCVLGLAYNLLSLIIFYL